MKKSIKLLILSFALLTLLFVSCNKDEQTTEYQDVKANIEVLYYSNNKSENTGILSFKDKETYILTLKSLKQRVEQHDLDFIDLYSHLDIEELNKKDKEIGFDEYKPLKEFEQTYKFRSLLMDYINFEDEWLKHDELDLKNNPSNHFNDLDEAELTLLNRDYAVIIDDSIFVTKKDGIIQISDISFNTLNQINKFKRIEQINEKDFSNIKIYPTIVNQNRSCHSYGNHSDDYGFSNSEEGSSNRYKIWYHVKFYRKYFSPYQLRFRAKTKTYKRFKSWVGYYYYDRYRFARLKAGVSGNYTYSEEGSFNGCNGDHYINDYNVKWNTSKVEYEYDIGVPNQDYHFDIADDAITGYHQAIVKPAGHQYVRLHFIP